MPNVQGGSLADFRTDMTVAGTQRRLTCWSRAWTDVAQGLMNAGIAHLNLTRSMMTLTPEEWQHASRPPASREALHQVLQDAHTRAMAARDGYRRINDDLTATLFAAADTLVETLPCALVSPTMTHQMADFQQADTSPPTAS